MEELTLHRFYQILEIAPDSPLDEVKEAYYRAAKKNHPDLFPEEERQRRQLLMMKVNEAYLTIVSQRDRESGGRDAGKSKNSSAKPASDTGTAVGPLKDPAYTYYKLGFKYYTAGRKAFFDRYKPQENRYHYMTGNREILMLAISCLRLYEKSYSYFLKVAEEYPDSVWYRDTVTKMYYLERYNAIYHRICMSIAAQLEDT